MDEEARQLVSLIACFAGPVLLSPLVVIALRPLFTVFLREGLELFTEVALQAELARAIANLLAIVNVTVLIAAWVAGFGCYLYCPLAALGMLVVVSGVLAALALTVHLVRDRVGISGRPAMLVGLLTFTGGNLPLFILVPAALVVR